VKRLVQVADEMQKELEREQFFRSGRREAAQLGGELLDLVDDARPGRTGARGFSRRQFRMSLAGGLEVAVGELDVDEVPVARGLVANFGRLAVGVAILVRPGRAADEIGRSEIVFVRGEQSVDFLFRRRREPRVGARAGNLVAAVAPGKNPSGGERKPESQSRAEDTPCRSPHPVAHEARAQAFFSPASTRSGVNGASRRRTPTASKIALAMAAAIGALEGSPPPSAGISGRLIRTMSISGISGKRMTG